LIFDDFFIYLIREGGDMRDLSIWERWMEREFFLWEMEIIMMEISKTTNLMVLFFKEFS